MQTQYKLTSYIIDKNDILIQVDSAWESFALENHGVELMSRNVIGRSLWDFVTDETTVFLYKELLAKVRSGTDVHFTFRCDSPDVRRFLEMHITGTANGDIQFQTIVNLLEERKHQNLYDRTAERQKKTVITCSWCKKVHTEQNTWLEVEAAVEMLGLFDPDRTPTLSHGICPACEEMVRKTLGGHQSAIPRRQM